MICCHTGQYFHYIFFYLFFFFENLVVLVHITYRHPKMNSTILRTSRKFFFSIELFKSSRRKNANPPPDAFLHLLKRTTLLSFLFLKAELLKGGFLQGGMHTTLLSETGVQCSVAEREKKQTHYLGLTSTLLLFKKKEE